MATLKELIVTFKADTKPVLDSLNSLDRKIENSSRKLKRLGNDMQNLGKKMSLALTLPTAAIGVTSTKALADFQSVEASFSSVIEKFRQGRSVQQAVSDEFTYLKDISKELGVSFQDMLTPYVQYMAASKDNLETTRKVAKSFLALSTSLGLPAERVKLIMRALQQMQSKGTIMAEELKLQLGDSVPGAIGLFAEAMGVGTDAFLDMMKQGKVSSKLLDDVADLIVKKYGLAIEKGAKTIRANFNRLKNSLYMFRVSLGRTIDEVFKVNDNLGSFASWLNKVASNLDRLDSKGKKILMFFTVLAVALGPVLFALGLIVKALPIMALGFRLLTGPVGLFLTLAGTIATYWEDIYNYVKGVFKLFTGKVLEVKQTKTVNLESEDSKKALASLGLKVKPPAYNFTPMDKSLTEPYLKSNMTNTSNNSTINNNLTINIPNSVTASDSSNIKDAVKKAIREENQANFFNIGVQ